MKVTRRTKIAGTIAAVALLSGLTAGPANAATQISGTVASVGSSTGAQGASMVAVDTGGGAQQAVDTSKANVSGGTIKQGAKIDATGKMNGSVLQASTVRVTG